MLARDPSILLSAVIETGSRLMLLIKMKLPIECSFPPRLLWRIRFPYSWSRCIENPIQIGQSADVSLGIIPAIYQAH